MRLEWSGARDVPRGPPGAERPPDSRDGSQPAVAAHDIPDLLRGAGVAPAGAVPDSVAAHWFFFDLRPSIWKTGIRHSRCSHTRLYNLQRKGAP